MNDKTTKSRVRNDWKYMRHLMRLADEAMKEESPDFDSMQEIANEMIAASGTFAQYVEQQRQEAGA